MIGAEICLYRYGMGKGLIIGPIEEDDFVVDAAHFDWSSLSSRQTDALGEFELKIQKAAETMLKEFDWVEQMKMQDEMEQQEEDTD